jgi:hypothetical protein
MDVRLKDINPSLKDWMLFKNMMITFLGDTVIYLAKWTHWLCLMKFPSLSGSLKRFANFAKTNGLKAMVAIGGWNEGSVKYSEVCMYASYYLQLSRHIDIRWDHFGLDFI